MTVPLKVSRTALTSGLLAASSVVGRFDGGVICSEALTGGGVVGIAGAGFANSGRFAGVRGVGVASCRTG
ncbi:MAG: hypothetical protein JKY43_05295 [Phycisphaerales bacterium]|nr:hypothetical protein [Phycisphaerales bacterium]